MGVGRLMWVSCAGLPSEIRDILAAVGERATSRQENHVLWSQTLEELSHIPVSYSHAAIDYQLAYHRGHGGDWWDISLVLYHDGRPCGVWPLSFSVNSGKASLTSYGFPVLPPFFVNGFLDKSRKTLVKECLDLLGEICRTGSVPEWESAESFAGQSGVGLSEWHDQSLRRGATVILRHELFVDLSVEIATLKARFRKSYKSLITSGTRTWQVSVMTEANQKVWSEFRELHLKVSGRVTRSAESWEFQHQAIVDRNAFLVVLRNDRGGMVGGGFFNMTRDEGVYGVGAYDRSLFDKPLGHVVQYRAIEEMKSRGLRWYKIGMRPYSAELPTPTEKELSIAEFKQGFGANLFPQYVLRHEVKKNDCS